MVKTMITLLIVMVNTMVKVILVTSVTMERSQDHLMEQLWRAIRYDQISDEEPNLNPNMDDVLCAHLRWEEATKSDGEQHFPSSSTITCNHSTTAWWPQSTIPRGQSPKVLIRWCQRRSQYRWRAEWRRGSDVLKDTGLTWWLWLGPVIERMGPVPRRRDLFPGICNCHWPAAFLAKYFASQVTYNVSQLALSSAQYVLPSLAENWINRWAGMDFPLNSWWVCHY